MMQKAPKAQKKALLSARKQTAVKCFRYGIRKAPSFFEHGFDHDTRILKLLKSVIEEVLRRIRDLLLFSF